jgi:hypothetical protein
MRRRPTLAVLGCLLAVTQVLANGATSAPQNSADPRRARAKIVKSVDLKATRLGDVPFSDPYAAPVGSGKAKGASFQLPDRALPTEPQGGFTIKAGRDSPDAPMTGGLMFRF